MTAKILVSILLHPVLAMKCQSSIKSIESYHVAAVDRLLSPLHVISYCSIIDIVFL